MINQNGKAMDVTQAKDAEGQYVATGSKTDGASQKWNIVYVDKKEQEKTTGENEDFGFTIGKPFYIISKSYMNRGLYANSNQ